MRKMYVDAEEVSKDWGVSKPKAYKINRKFYEENCYGQTKEV